METRANYILIGAFTLAGMLGLLGFFLWFAQVELDRQFAYYEIRFETVSGLGQAGVVRFSGLPVGQVVLMGLDPAGDGRVRVRVEVAADTPIRTDSVATLESQGVTGVSYISITPGSADAPLLIEADDTLFPQIQSGRSAFQTLTEDAPDLITEAADVIRQLGEILGPENQGRVAAILENLEQSSGALDAAMADFSGITGNIANAADEVAAFSGSLDEIVTSATSTLRMADTALLSFTQLSTAAQVTLDAGTQALGAAESTFAEGQRLMQGPLQTLMANMAETVATVRGEVALLASDARATLAQFGDAGAAATARLNDAETTLTAANTAIEALTETLASIDGAATRFDTLLAEEGTALVTDARAAITSAGATMDRLGEMAETELPAILADVRATSETARAAILTLSSDLSGFTGRLDGLTDEVETALATATDTFTRANDTLEAIDEAMIAAESTLEVAESAFAGANRVINEDVAGITADLRVTMSRLDAALAQVAEDLPAVTADLRATMAGARTTFEEVGGVITTAGDSVQSFATSGLPQYTQLAQETRNLIRSLERLTSQIERDPTRFLLGRQTPEFRR